MEVRPDVMYQARTALDAVNDATVATPAPVMPNGGNGPMPNISVGFGRIATRETRTRSSVSFLTADAHKMCRRLTRSLV
jgi:hypothetical protein